jgi:hypothetical protein
VLLAQTSAARTHVNRAIGQLEQLPIDPLLFSVYNQPRYKHRERPVVKHRELIYPEPLKFRVEHYEKADSRE